MSTPVQQQGFSVIELIVVVVLLGILSVYAVSKFSDRNAYSASASEDQLISAIRYAQQVAMNRGPNANVTLVFNSGSYQIVDGNAIPLPGGGTSADLPDGSSISPAPTTIAFDSLGNTVAQTVLTISVSGEPNRQVCIETTGYAHGC